MVDLILDGSTTPSNCIRRSTSSSVICATCPASKLQRLTVSLALLSCHPAQSGLGTLHYRNSNSVLSSVAIFPTPSSWYFTYSSSFRTSRNVRLLYLHTYNIYTSAKIAKFRFTPIYTKRFFGQLRVSGQRAPHPAIPAHNGRRNDLSAASSLPHRGLSVRLAKRWYGNVFGTQGGIFGKKWPHGKANPLLLSVPLWKEDKSYPNNRHNAAGSRGRVRRALGITSPSGVT